jgi:chorismate synthase
MRGQWGDKLQLSIFGESHGEAVGIVLDGLPAGVELELEAIAADLRRRAPGRDMASTPRRAPDTPRVLSGV